MLGFVKMLSQRQSFPKSILQQCLFLALFFCWLGLLVLILAAGQISWWWVFAPGFFLTNFVWPSPDAPNDMSAGRPAPARHPRAEGSGRARPPSVRPAVFPTLHDRLRPARRGGRGRGQRRDERCHRFAQRRVHEPWVYYLSTLVQHLQLTMETLLRKGRRGLLPISYTQTLNDLLAR